MKEEFENDQAFFRQTIGKHEEPGLDWNDLAALIDDNLEEAERDRLEAQLAGDPEALGYFLALREETPTVALPKKCLRRAQALVADERSVRSTDWRAAVVGFFRNFMEPGLEWGALAASFVFVAMVGFYIGQDTQLNITEEQWVQDLSANFSDEMFLLEDEFEIGGDQ